MGIKDDKGKVYYDPYFKIVVNIRNNWYPNEKVKNNPESKRNKVYKRDGYKCLKCGSTENLTLDHVYPRSKGGGNGIKNLQTLCLKCNMEKADNYADYRK